MKPRSLFSRVVLMQALIALGLLLLFGLTFYVERNITVAQLLGDLWAPALRSAVGLEPAPPPQALRHSEVYPPGAQTVSSWAPRVNALRSTLEADGVPVRQLALERDGPRATVWIELELAGGSTRWIGFDDHRFVEPVAGRRLLLTLAAVLALVAFASWRFTRRLTRPLDELRTRMQAHQPGTGDAAQPPEPPLAANASAEVQAIDAAWRAMCERLARHERERALLLAGVSHDLRSPLARIRMAAALLPDDARTAPRRVAIERSVQVADRLIDDFLDQVRFGTLALDQDVDLAAAARQIASEQPQLQLQAPPALVLNRAHPRLVERLLGNLVDNAFKHGRAPVRLSLAAVGAGAVVEVADGGAGIAETERETLLQAFARGDASRGTPGTGLGLAIVREGVERLRGRIEFAQPAGGGFVVRLHLPGG